MTTVDRASLQPGDCLLYAPGKGLFGWIISLKTWHSIAHCEGYLGQGLSVASRDGLGVGMYPFREAGLSAVWRPIVPFDQVRAQHWFWSVNGQKYDWLGLLRFAWRAKVRNDGNKQFCSEFLTRWYRAGGIDPFNGEDADAIPPYLFGVSSMFRKVWSAPEKVESQHL